MEYAIRSEVGQLGESERGGALENVEELMRLYRTRLLRFVMLSVGDSDMAETITQDTFLRAYQTRAQFRGDCSVNTWLTRIAYNLLRDHTRLERYKFWKRAGQNAIEAGTLAGSLPGRDRSAEQQVMARQQLGAVLAAVQQLPAQQRTVFTLHFIEEMSVAEIAETLAMRTSTVKTHLYRAIGRIRTLKEERA